MKTNIEFKNELERILILVRENLVNNGELAEIYDTRIVVCEALTNLINNTPTLSQTNVDYVLKVLKNRVEKLKKDLSWYDLHINDKLQRPSLIVPQANAKQKAREEREKIRLKIVNTNNAITELETQL